MQKLVLLVIFLLPTATLWSAQPHLECISSLQVSKSFTHDHFVLAAFGANNSKVISLTEQQFMQLRNTIIEHSQSVLESYQRRYPDASLESIHLETRVGRVTYLNMGKLAVLVKDPTQRADGTERKLVARLNIFIPKFGKRIEQSFEIKGFIDQVNDNLEAIGALSVLMNWTNEAHHFALILPDELLTQRGSSIPFQALDLESSMELYQNTHSEN